jgi:enoyl-CoA hydratase/carnithine racemase
MALPLDQALKLEAEIFGRLSETADKKEGVEAFLTKRKPTFHGK